jgi:hypothetical protein
MSGINNDYVYNGAYFILKVKCQCTIWMSKLWKMEGHSIVLKPTSFAIGDKTT